VGLNVHKVATLVGFETVVCDDRELYANPERFPDVHETDAGQSEKGKQSLMDQTGRYVADAVLGNFDRPGTHTQSLKRAVDDPGTFCNSRDSDHSSSYSYMATWPIRKEC